MNRPWNRPVADHSVLAGRRPWSAAAMLPPSLAEAVLRRGRKHGFRPEGASTACALRKRPALPAVFIGLPGQLELVGVLAMTCRYFDCAAARVLYVERVQALLHWLCPGNGSDAVVHPQ